MPIYAYKCGSCGFAKDVLQKVSDPVLTDCPQCGQSSFVKQLTAAGFQLKGSGWYATDFKGGSGSSTTVAPKAEETASATTGTAKKPDAAAPAAGCGCGAGCACHS